MLFVFKNTSSWLLQWW